MSTQDGQRAVRFPHTAGRVAALLGTAAVLAACGSDTGSESAGTPPDAAVRTQEHPELGTILVDRAGNTLYVTDQEADGDVSCAGSCLQFWIPATIQDGATPSGVAGLDTVQRQDNDQTQLTYQGQPLYTFSQDEAEGEAKGDNLADEFDGTRFVWHAVTVDAPDTTADAPPGGYGY